jgi:type IV fimbrial biogenesis protein FimT
MATRCMPPRSVVRAPRRAAGGFTAVELAVVVTIVVILGTIAMPSFADFTVNQRLRIAAYDLVADLTFARGEAVKRNSRVTVTRGGTTWASGWTITDVNGTTLRSHPAFDTTVVESTGPTSLQFGLDGHLVGTTTATFTFDDSESKSSIPVHKVIVDPSGRPRSI